MSATSHMKRITVPDIRARKGGDPVVVLTAYTTPAAKILDPHVDILLVGDSLGMVLYGLPTPLAVTLDMMIAHGAAVVRGSESAQVVVDMPFGSYKESPEQAYRSACRVMAETGCDAIKLEGGREMAPTIEFLTNRDIPVMGHVGMMPQSIHRYGGFRVQGKDAAGAQAAIGDARAVADAGAYSMVVEAVVEPLAGEITAAVPVPTIGIGASATCDGQVVVTEDMTGMFPDFTPKFVRKYASFGEDLSKAARQYAADVKARRFPGPAETYAPKKKTKS